MKKKVLCHKCRSLVPFTIKARNREREAYGKKYTYNELYGECDICHTEVGVPGLIDNNEKIFQQLVESSHEA